MTFKHIIRLIRNILLDLKFGRFLGGVKKTPYSTMGANDTANSDYCVMSLLFTDEIIKPNDTLVDIGCGKGRIINYWITNFPNNHIIGIELDSKIANKVARRLTRYRNVTIISGNATELIPDKGNLFYLFNPFNCYVMNSFKEALISKFFDQKLSCWIHSFSVIYYNPICAQIFLNDNKFTCNELEIPNGYHKCLLIKQSSIYTKELDLNSVEIS